jgi:preprotein translocase subunit SecG
MEQIVLVVHLLVALAIIGLIMLQQGKGADMGASFGAGASQTLFGSDGSGNVLTKATAWLVVLFFASSFGLALLANQKSAPVNDLDLMIPDAAPAAVEQVIEEELPVVEDELPAMSAPASEEEDLPALD